MQRGSSRFPTFPAPADRAIPKKPRTAVRASSLKASRYFPFQPRRIDDLVARQGESFPFVFSLAILTRGCVSPPALPSYPSSPRRRPPCTQTIATSSSATRSRSVPVPASSCDVSTASLGELSTARTFGEAPCPYDTSVASFGGRAGFRALRPPLARPRAVLLVRDATISSLHVLDAAKQFTEKRPVIRGRREPFAASSVVHRWCAANCGPSLNIVR